MRALRRIATPASVAVAIGGCTYAFDEYLPQTADAGVATNAKPGTIEPSADTAVVIDDGPLDSGVFETLAEDATDTSTDACTCVKYAGTKCREWSPPNCGE